MSTNSLKSIPTYGNVINMFMPDSTNILMLYYETEINNSFSNKTLTLSIPIPTDIIISLVENCTLFELTMSSACGEYNNNIGFDFHGYVYRNSSHNFYGFYKNNILSPEVLCITLGNVVRSKRTQELILNTQTSCFISLIILTLKCFIGK